MAPREPGHVEVRADVASQVRQAEVRTAAGPSHNARLRSGRLRPEAAPRGRWDQGRTRVARQVGCPVGPPGCSLVQNVDRVPALHSSVRARAPFASRALTAPEYIGVQRTDALREAPRRARLRDAVRQSAAMTTRRGARPTQVRPRPPSSGRPAPVKVRTRPPQPGRIASHRPIDAQPRPAAHDQAGPRPRRHRDRRRRPVCRRRRAGDRRGRASGDTFGGFVKGVTATPTPAPIDPDDLGCARAGRRRTSRTPTRHGRPRRHRARGDRRRHRARGPDLPRPQGPAPAGDRRRSRSPRAPGPVIPVELTKGINDFTVTIIGPGRRVRDVAVVRYVLDTAKPKITHHLAQERTRPSTARASSSRARSRARSTLIAHEQRQRRDDQPARRRPTGRSRSSLPLTTGLEPHHDQRRRIRRATKARAELTVRRGNGKLTVALERVGLHASRAGHCRSRSS